MTDAQNFTKLVPGFDFLQGLVKNAGAALPGMGQWVAPTLDPAELDKRIGELRTVQFWLEQNARMLGATIQALEVQRMTLSTLSTMNVQMEDLRDALMIRTPRAGAKKNDSKDEPAKPAKKAAPQAAKGDDAAAPSPAAAVDPMQWWGALTQQFTELASNAMKEGSAGAAQQMAESMTQQGLDAVQKTMQAAAASAAPAKPDKRKKAGDTKRAAKR